MKAETTKILPATVDDLADIRRLFAEYVAGLGVDLSFQGAERELATLPGKYGPPGGALFVARGPGGRALGAVGLRPLAEPGECEIKRLYVRPEARGQDLGRRLASEAVAAARSAGYRLVRLDTLASMAAAQTLYRSLGFRETGPYYANPLAGTRYLALDLPPRIS